MKKYLLPIQYLIMGFYMIKISEDNPNIIIGAFGWLIGTSLCIIYFVKLEK
jgi:hypothetical protein